MRIPPRTLVALVMVVLGTALAAAAVSALWEPEAAGLVVGVVLLSFGVLLGVSE